VSLTWASSAEAYGCASPHPRIHAVPFSCIELNEFYCIPNRLSGRDEDFSRCPADIEHIIFWSVGIVAAFVLLARLSDFRQQALLLLVLAPGLILSTFLNQSSSEHPDYYNIFWHPAVVLGWTYLLLFFLSRLPSGTHQLDLRVFASAIIVWSLFLWQIRYFILAYFPV
jgi:hypothetical protein